MTDQYQAPVVPEPEQPKTPEEIADEARASFSLSDRLKGIKHRETKVLIFLDPQAADEYHALNAQVQKLSDMIGQIDLVGLKTKLDVALEGGGIAEHSAAQETLAYDMASRKHADLTERFNAADEKLEAARQKMLENALSIHLRAFPNIAASAARRKALKKFTDKATKLVPDDKALEFGDYIDSILFGDSIVKVVDAQGNEMDLGKRSELFEKFSSELPPSQWDRLYTAWTELVFTEQIARDAIDPGF